MNNIAFAGYAEGTAEPLTGKYFEIIVPQANCTVEHGGEKADFCRGEIAIVPPLFKCLFKGKAVRVSLEQALLPFKQIRIIRDDKCGGIEHAARQAAEYYSAENSTRSGVLAALGELLVAYVIKFSEGRNLSPVVETVMGEIDKNLSHSTYSLEDSIKKLPLNYDYVRKLFKKETGITPHEYLINSRMQLARDLIASGMGNRYSNYSVGQIAEACGFAEPLYFSRVFKKHYGIAPTEARQIWTKN